MDDDEFSFDFEAKLQEQKRQEEQQKALASSSGPDIPPDIAIPVNQSAGSFKRNYRQVTCFEPRRL